MSDYYIVLWHEPGSKEQSDYVFTFKSREDAQSHIEKEIAANETVYLAKLTDIEKITLKFETVYNKYAD